MSTADELISYQVTRVVDADGDVFYLAGHATPEGLVEQFGTGEMEVLYLLAALPDFVLV